MNDFSYQILQNGLLVHTAHAHVKLTPYSSNCIRVRYGLNSEFGVRESYLVNVEPPCDVDFSVVETPAAVLLSTAQMTIEISKKNLAFQYLDAAGKILTKEPPRGGKLLEPVEVIVHHYGQTGALSTEQGADGLKIRALGSHTTVTKQAYRARIDFEWCEGEALYGLGSHEEGMFNLRGQHQYLYQQNMKITIPVLLSTRGYGIIFDQYSLMTFHDDAFGSYLWMDVVDELDYYFVYGPEFDSIIHTIRSLTGTAPMLPKWAFGYIQSKERYKSQEELIDIVLEYRQRRLPLDCIVLDWQSWPDQLWGEKILDPVRFPDPKQMLETIHNLNARLMVSIWPNLSPGGNNWQEMQDHEYLLGNRSTYDAFNPAARELYWKQAVDGFFQYGVDAWWCDCTEPFEADWRGPVKPEPEERMRINIGEAKAYLDPEKINLYSLFHTRGIYEGQRNSGSEKRVVILTRSGYLGQQRYSTILWSGDVAARWEVLRKQIADGLNFCAAGMPYWTVDIGAFFVKTRPEMWFWNGDYEQAGDDLGFRELYVRWFQFGAFLPMFRAHGTDASREIWHFGDPGDVMYEALVSMLRLRYRLMPYIYSLAAWTTQRHYTMLRALPFDFRDDPQTYQISDQFMFGPSLLVNPVTRPMYFGVNSTPLDAVEKSRPVYLPSGSDWVDLWTGRRYAGGQTIAADAPIDVLPLFARAGSMIPLWPEVQYVDELANPPIELRIYPGGDCTFSLYFDEGDTYHYEQGVYATVALQWVDNQRLLIFGDRQGSYPGMEPSILMNVVLVEDGRTLSDAVPVVYEGKRIEVLIAAAPQIS